VGATKILKNYFNPLTSYQQEIVGDYFLGAPGTCRNKSVFSFAFVLDQKLGVALRQVVDDEFAEEKARRTACRGRFFVRCNDRVEEAAVLAIDAAVLAARDARRLAELLRLAADERATDRHASHEHHQRLADADPPALLICHIRTLLNSNGDKLWLYCIYTTLTRFNDQFQGQSVCKTV